MKKEKSKTKLYVMKAPFPNVNGILHDNLGYLQGHPGRSLIITYQWDESSDTWRTLVTTTDSGSDQTESRCSDPTSCAQQTSPSDQKEHSLKHLLEQESYVTQENSSEATAVSSTSLQHGNRRPKHGEPLAPDSNRRPQHSDLSEAKSQYDFFKKVLANSEDTGKMMRKIEEHL